MTTAHNWGPLQPFVDDLVVSLQKGHQSLAVQAALEDLDTGNPTGQFIVAVEQELEALEGLHLKVKAFSATLPTATWQTLQEVFRDIEAYVERHPGVDIRASDDPSKGIMGWGTLMHWWGLPAKTMQAYHPGYNQRLQELVQTPGGRREIAEVLSQRHSHLFKRKTL